MRRLLMALAACSLVLAACGDTDGDGDADLDPVAAAEQRVARAEEDLTERESTFDEASEQFCGDATDYVDRRRPLRPPVHRCRGDRRGRDDGRT